MTAEAEVLLRLTGRLTLDSAAVDHIRVLLTAAQEATSLRKGKPLDPEYHCAGCGAWAYDHAPTHAKGCPLLTAIKEIGSLLSKADELINRAS